ncbi:MAG: hypothetical protein R2831_00900 [Chitinophagaceae bacterium]
MKQLINNYKKQSTLLKITIGISLLLLIISLTQPAFYIDRKEDPNAYSDSLTLFFLGWMSFLGGAFIPFILWLANPLYFISIFLTIKNKPSGLFVSIAASTLAFIFSQLDTIMTSESGSCSIITSRGLGFKLWFASLIILTVGLVLSRIMMNKKSVTI